jgi:hypothetical protein
METETEISIVHNLRVDRRVWAICEIWNYDTWGNAREGWDVNDRSCEDRSMRIPAEVTISNVPRFPGVKDAYRTFSDSASFSCDMMVAFSIPDKEIRKIFGKGIEVESSDGTDYEVSLKRNGKPIGQIIITGWTDKEEE